MKSARKTTRLVPGVMFWIFTACAPAFGLSFTVNTTTDSIDADPGNGVCADATGLCSLRAAVLEANATSNADRIDLPAGTYTLSIPNSGGG